MVPQKRTDSGVRSETLTIPELEQSRQTNYAFLCIINGFHFAWHHLCGASEAENHKGHYDKLGLYF
jgi:hypothetical protein